MGWVDERIRGRSSTFFLRPVSLVDKLQLEMCTLSDLVSLFVKVIVTDIAVGMPPVIDIVSDSSGRMKKLERRKNQICFSHLQPTDSVAVVAVKCDPPFWSFEDLPSHSLAARLGMPRRCIRVSPC